jgi:hypothetical protein
MKKFLLFNMLMLAMVLVLSSCGDSKNDEPTVDPEKSPVITLSATGSGGATGGITANQTYQVGSTVPNELVFFVNTSKNSTTNEKLESFEVTLSVNNASPLMVSGFPQELRNAERDGFVAREVRVPAPTAAGTYVYNFRVIDNKNFLGVVSISITIQAQVDCSSSTANTLALPAANVTSGVYAFTATGGATPYLYSFDGGETWSATTTFTPTKNGTYTAYVVDDNGCVATREFSVTNLSLTEYVGVVLGGQTNTNPSAYNVKTNTRWSIVKFTEQKASLDFVYYYGTTNMATIASPSDATVAEVFGAYGISTSGANSVQFKKLTTTPYAGATTGSSMSDTWTASGATASSLATSLAANNEIAFRTTSGGSDVYGIIKVTAISASSASGAITFSVKRQQIGSEITAP